MQNDRNNALLFFKILIKKTVSSNFKSFLFLDIQGQTEHPVAWWSFGENVTDTVLYSLFVGLKADYSIEKNYFLFFMCSFLLHSEFHFVTGVGFGL